MKPARGTGSRNGFTLTELLLVIAVVGVLTALLLAAVLSAKARSHSAQCQNRLRQIGLALQMYVHDNGRYPHFRSLPEANGNDSVATEDNRWWWAKLLPYHQIKWTDRQYHCPGYKGEIAGTSNARNPIGSYAYNTRGIRPPFGGYENSSLGISIRYRSVNLGLGPTLYVTVPGVRPQAVTEAQIQVPSEMFAIGESRFLNAQVNGTPGGETAMVSGLIRWAGKEGEYAFDPERHGKNYNQLFCDGHVAAMSPLALFNPTNTARMWNRDHEPHQELWIPD